MDERQSTTALTRKAITKKLEENQGKRYSESELFDLIAEEVPALIQRDPDGQASERRSVLRGIINKLDEIPVENLGVFRDGSRVYYYYAGDSFTQFAILVDEFVNKVTESKSLTIDFLEATDGEIEFVRKASDLIKNLKELAEIQPH
ncbi:hypothetical protein ACIQYL_20520 [Lysinibacillus xylanilyticus]|uniref:hypothetical protein n=1 Tax=Lysinibacillus xylanilyticus TaxID=582475 RepID=UPI00380B31C4